MRGNALCVAVFPAASDSGAQPRSKTATPCSRCEQPGCDELRTATCLLKSRFPAGSREFSSDSLRLASGSCLSSPGSRRSAAPRCMRSRRVAGGRRRLGTLAPYGSSETGRVPCAPRERAPRARCASYRRAGLGSETRCASSTTSESATSLGMPLSAMVWRVATRAHPSQGRAAVRHGR